MLTKWNVNSLKCKIVEYPTPDMSLLNICSLICMLSFSFFWGGSGGGTTDCAQGLLVALYSERIILAGLTRSYGLLKIKSGLSVCRISTLHNSRHLYVFLPLDMQYQYMNVMYVCCQLTHRISDSRAAINVDSRTVVTQVSLSRKLRDFQQHLVSR